MNSFSMTSIAVNTEGAEISETRFLPAAVCSVTIICTHITLNIDFSAMYSHPAPYTSGTGDRIT